MNTITYSSVRSNLAQTMEKVCDDHAPVIITRKAARQFDLDFGKMRGKTEEPGGGIVSTSRLEEKLSDMQRREMY
jgi:hypothetical protein